MGRRYMTVVKRTAFSGPMVKARSDAPGNVRSMVRRSFRLGLRLGLLIGIAFAIVKTMQSRRAHREPAPEPWQPIVDTPRPRPAQTRAEERPVDEVGEPVEEPAPTVVEEGVEVRDVAAPTPPSSTYTTPLDVVAEKPVAPVKKATKTAKKAVKKAAKVAKKAAAAPVTAFVEPVGGVCPPTHQVKAKVASKLFHLPGMLAYDRTRPDRCYVDAAAAEADGFTKARR